jgi:hypothetical protein
VWTPNRIIENSLVAEKRKLLFFFLVQQIVILSLRHPLSSTKSSDFNIYNDEPTKPSLEHDFWGEFWWQARLGLKFHEPSRASYESAQLGSIPPLDILQLRYYSFRFKIIELLLLS